MMFDHSLLKPIIAVLAIPFQPPFCRPLLKSVSVIPFAFFCPETPFAHSLLKLY